jgi:endonuclease/exonuclease/phosphatase family metal-dependent hydrolase
MLKFKILLLNLGYCAELNGSLSQYIFGFYKYFFLPNKIQERVLKKLKKIISEEKPDLICITEIKKGEQILSLINDKYPHYNIGTKYGKESSLRKLPFFRDNGNAFISRKKLPFKKQFLKHGTKKLLYEIMLPNKTKLLLTHFSLKKEVRKKQFAEIQKKYGKTNSKIICGDFNISSGFDELDYLIKDSKLKFAHKGPTFPAFSPKKSLDLFLCSEKLDAKAKVLKNQLSDHLPVILEIKL